MRALLAWLALYALIFIVWHAGQRMSADASIDIPPMPAHYQGVTK